MLRLYNAALWPLRLATEVLARIRGRGGASAREWAERRGLARPDAPGGAVWIHGASVGEARLVTALAHRLHDLAPDLPLVASAVTPTGRSRLPDSPHVAASFFAPLDFPGPVGRVLDSLRPRLLVLLETELWPNLLHRCHGAGVPVCVVNGRLSPERLARYRRFRSLYRPLVARLAAVGAQDPEQARRFSELGTPPSRIEITGNMKYDLPPPTGDRQATRGRLGVEGTRPVLVAGSTAEKEETPILDAFEAVRRRFPETLLILAPRRPERFGPAGEAAAARGLRVARRSGGLEAGPEVDVFVLDALGELAGFYAAADGAFVGGSLVPIGGHNLLEPAASGIPVAFGPHTGHVEEPAEALLGCGGGVRVGDSADLARNWERWIADPRLRDRTGAAARALVESGRGAVDRNVALIVRLAGTPGGGSR